jgi:hypothetical protein
MTNTTIANTAEKIVLREILKTGNLNSFTEFHFENTAHKFIVCACRHVQRDKQPISLKSVCRCLCDYGQEEFAKIAESLFNEEDQLWIPPM